MSRRPQGKSSVSKFAGRALAQYMRFVHSTSSIVTVPEDQPALSLVYQPFILAMWHGQFMMMPLIHWGGFPVAAIVARHGDAEVIGEMLGHFDISLVRGAGAGTRLRDRGGAHALRAAAKALKAGTTFAMTADVPPGPARRAGTGIVMLAKLSGRPILPFAVASSRYFALKTWSRMTINLPYSRMAYVIGDPITVAADADEEAIEAARLAVEQGLNAVTARAYELAGADPARATPPEPLGPESPPAPLGFALKAYRGGTSLMRLAAPLLLKIRERQGKEDPRRRGERLGQASVPRPEGPLMWLHAASVGETNAVLPLIERLTARDPRLSVVLTTGTVTSAGLAAQRLGPRAIHQYVPLDAPEYARRFLDHWRPDLAVLTESEVWPNLILATAERGIPLALVNARMSPRSYQRWKRNRALSAPLFSRFDIILAQNEKLARNFTELGARHSVAVGNLKIDAPPPPVDVVALERLRTALAGRPVLVAASTHEGEEDIVAEAHRQLARQVPGICTIIAPRHPERGTGIAENLKGQGFTVAQRSAGQLPSERTDIYIADTIGELGTLYALGAVAFIGGSLVERGGQNPIEAIGHGAVVLTGPHWRNFRDFYRALMRHKGAIQVSNAAELASAAGELITNEAELQRMRAGAKTALLSLSGALERTTEALAALLPPPGEGVRRAS